MMGAQFQDYLALARAGHPDAWTLLYDRVAPVVYGYLRSQSLSDPEDVAGETFLQMVRDIDSFEGSQRAFRSWVLGIAHHRMLDARRASGRRPTVPVATEDLPPAERGIDNTVDAMERADWSPVARHLQVLTEEQRMVVTLRVLGEMTLEETAATLDRSVGSVKALQHRAFIALRAHLASSRNPVGAPDAHSVWHS